MSQPQLEIVYMTANTSLVGVGKNVQYDDSRYQPESSIYSSGLTAGFGSSLACYWPYVVRLDSSDTITVTKQDSEWGHKLSPSGIWLTQSLDIAAGTKSQLALVPLSVNYSQIVTAGGYGVFYQDVDENLASLQPDRALAVANDTLVDSWPTGKFTSVFASGS